MGRNRKDSSCAVIGLGSSCAVKVWNGPKQNIGARDTSMCWTRPLIVVKPKHAYLTIYFGEQTQVGIAKEDAKLFAEALLELTKSVVR